MKLTNRDKMLLTIMLLVVVWVLGIVFFGKPRIDDLSSKNKELKSVNSEFDTVKVELEAAKTVKDDCNNALKDAQKAAANFFAVPKAAYEAERYLANVLQGDASGKGKIEISSMSISGPSANSLAPYDPTDAILLDIPINDSADFTPVTDSTTTATTIAGETLGCYECSVNFEATRENLMQFLTNIKTVNIDGASANSLIVNNLNIEEINVEEGENLKGTLSFSLYFISKLEGDNVDDILEKQMATVETEENTDDK